MGFACKHSMTVLFVITGIASLLSGQAGCLVPPPIDEEPTFQNSAPWLDKNELSPHPAKGPVVMSVACEAYDFRALLTDRDKNDTLYWRFFLDYHRDIFQDSLVQQEISDPTAQGGKQVSFTVHPNDPRFFQGTSVEGIHTVEILLSDRPFDEERLPPGRFAVDSEGFVDSFIWPIEIVSDESDCEESSQ